MTSWFYWAFYWAICLGIASANPVISEMMANNVSSITDEDGSSSDWIEIHNPTSTPISLAGWYLTDKPDQPTRWPFPNVTLQPGEFLIVWASDKNRRVAGAPLHTNFALSKDGEYLALVRPGGTVQQQFDPKFPALAADESYGFRFQSTSLVRVGDSGKYRAGTSITPSVATWTASQYDDSSWSIGNSGFGFGITTPGITVRKVSKNGSMTGLSDALSLIALTPPNASILATTTVISPLLNILGEGVEGHYGYNSALPDGYLDNYAIIASGWITIPTSGTYTFGLNSDDGGRIQIDDTEVMRDDTFHGPEDHFGSIYLTAGQHSFQALMFEGGGGDSVEFFAAPGTLTSFDANVFRLVGDVANGGLAASTVPSEGGLVATNIASTMGNNPGTYLRMAFTPSLPLQATALSLLLRVSDGAHVWLNGTPVASLNSPVSPAWNSYATGTRSNAEALTPFPINVTSALSSITSGKNVLAIHGMRSSANDPSFLVLPELIAGSIDTNVAPAYFGSGLATPGWINGRPSSLGNVADTQFSVKRGVFTNPIQVIITSATPGASIRYTTDGSTPDESNGMLYTTPIQISSTTVLRARALLDDWKSTDVDTQTYLFPADIIHQSADGAPPSGWPASSGTLQQLDYGMDPEIVFHADPNLGGASAVKSALLALPIVSITTDLPNLFDLNGSQGIYSHPSGRGFAWERPASVEWISPPDSEHPNGEGAFQINAGIRLRGGFSRSEENPKHAFRLFFREEYGATKLRYPLFGNDGASEFDKIDLRTAQNYSWSFGGDSRNTFLREESCRQALLDMGQPGSHVRYVHLYLNGQYWGLYNLDERTEAAFAESYFGGSKDDYDVVKAEQEADYTIGATDGNLVAWQNLWNLGKSHRANPNPTNFFRMMGLAGDGLTPTNDPVLLDLDNLIDYLLLTFWSGNLDGCVSNFLGNQRGNNWYGTRLREGNPRAGFRFFVHDFEHTMLDVNEDRTGPFNNDSESQFIYSNPLFLHQDLSANSEYRMRWADRIHHHLFDHGALTADAWQNRINVLAASVNAAIIAESARWGDAKTSPPLNRADWNNAQQELINHVRSRQAVILNQLRVDGLYPSLDAPELSPADGRHPSGTLVSIQAPASATIYYMADGSDPRAVGGTTKSNALTYSTSTSSETLIPWSASGWKYLADGSNPGDAWRFAAFNDAAWSIGTAELGYGDNDEATVIPIVDVDSATPGVQKAAGYFFRKSFSVTDPANITGLLVKTEYDDAYAVYLNGTRVAGNLPNEVSFNTYVGQYIEDTVESVSIPASLLQPGSNMLAVEIHQSHNSSSDISLNLSLLATRSTTATPLILSGSGQRTLRFRAKQGSTWSALAESTYQVGTLAPTPTTLVVSEICYAPSAPHGESEFIELLNIGTDPLDLGGARFTVGVDFTFPANTTLLPGSRILVVRDLAAFELVHGTSMPVVGTFASDTALSNAGERLRLESSDGKTLLDFSYETAFPWPDAAYDQGRSMVLIGQADPANPTSWRASTTLYGNPGSTDSFVRPSGQSLIDYALATSVPTFDHGSGSCSIKRRLGADAAHITAEWSDDCANWSSQQLTLVSESPDAEGNSTLTWKLDFLPEQRAFIRIKVQE